MSDFEKKMAEFDKEIVNARTEGERAEVLQRIVTALDDEMRAQGLSAEEREDKITMFLNEILDLLPEGDGPAEDLDDARER